MIPVFAFLICALLRALPPCARIKDWRERSAADAESRHTRALLETLEQLDGQQDELRPKQKLLKEYLQQEAAPAEAVVAQQEHEQQGEEQEQEQEQEREREQELENARRTPNHRTQG